MGEAWKVAKVLLEEDIAAGIVPVDEEAMDARTVYESRPLYRNVRWARFQVNLKNLRDKTAAKQSYAASDSAAIERDLKKYPRPTHNGRGIPRWEGSQAQSLVKGVVVAEMDQGREATIRNFNTKHQVFQGYTPDYLRGKIDQEVRAAKYINYLQRKQSEKRTKQLAKRAKQLEKVRNRSVATAAPATQSTTTAAPEAATQAAATTPKSPICSRCGEHGHARPTNKKCKFYVARKKPEKVGAK